MFVASIPSRKNRTPVGPCSSKATYPTLESFFNRISPLASYLELVLVICNTASVSEIGRFTLAAATYKEADRIYVEFSRVNLLSLPQSLQSLDCVSRNSKRFLQHGIRDS
ncbi:hypothetical protein Mapa_012143 [Marchantia paleacea]|nr:hypothetical protein Mapa_012143 [Marchantia paleacea]